MGTVPQLTRNDVLHLEAEQLEKRIGKKLDVRVISKGMELLGLNKVSEKKKTELARNNKSQPERSYK